MRIDKVLEEKGFGSRKVVKRLFQRKVVLVNGEAVVDGSFNVEERLHRVTVAGEEIRGFTHIYLMMNKPNGVVTAITDATRKTVLDLVKKEDKTVDVYPVGRLDRDTEGLLLLTDNGQLGYQLLIPDKKVSKTYEVTTKEPLETEDVDKFARGIIFIGGETCKPAHLELLDEHRARLTISEGKFHQVKKMFLAVGKKVVHLKRTAMGPLELDPGLGLGDYRPLSDTELALLKPYFTYKGG
ncbi:16S rRNA pseudouridine(516) synthase [Jeotgalibaca sp. A127]|uniref:16S rRNA pseudouridine(516) synthase n=1 Tax=Jeotgalibaca sp. A127 TaxID=3457324 RepID=UPI003FD3ABC1